MASQPDERRGTLQLYVKSGAERLDVMVDDRESADQLWAMADLVTPMAVRVAATLRIADRVAQGLRTAPELAAAVDADRDALDRLLRHLTTVGVLDRDGSGRYGLTGLGAVLRDDHPNGVRAVLDLEGAVGRADLCFGELLHVVRTGEPGFPVHFGRPFWDDVTADPARAASYAKEMGSEVAAWAPHVLSACDWGSLGHIVDVGGGNGTLLIALLRAHPDLRGTVVDLPDTAEAARTALRAAGLGERGAAVAGSFFDPLPAGAGGYVLCAILHDWDDEAAEAILRRCGEAAGADGGIFVVEKIGADGETIQTAMDLRVLAYFGGRERGVADLTAMAVRSGLSVVAVHPAGPLAVVELSAVLPGEPV